MNAVGTRNPAAARGQVVLGDDERTGNQGLRLPMPSKPALQQPDGFATAVRDAEAA